jgi:hypothetical protein
MFIEVPLRGAKFRTLSEQTKVLELEVGQEVKLVPEPTNKYDTNAVKIIVAGELGETFHLGYIPKEFSAQVAEAMRDTILTATVAKINGLYPEFTVIAHD